MQSIETDITVINLQSKNASDTVKSNYEPVRYNAMKHGILSKLAVLPHEDSEEFENLYAALLEEHQPQGMTERHLVEELASIIWRKRRVLLAEGSQINHGLKSTVRNTESVVSAAVPFQGGISSRGIDLRDVVATTSNENLESLQYADRDLNATQLSSKILFKGGANAYRRARHALHEDSRDLWDEHVKEGSYSANSEGLKTWIDVWLLPYCYQAMLEAHSQPAIKAQTLGEGLQTHRFESLTRYETHLDRKFERILAMLIKMKELRNQQ